MEMIIACGFAWIVVISAAYFVSILVRFIFRVVSWLVSLPFKPFVWLYNQHKKNRRIEEISKEVLKSYNLTVSQYDRLDGKFFRKEVQSKIALQRALEGI